MAKNTRSGRTTWWCSTEKPFLTVKSGREGLDCMREMNESTQMQEILDYIRCHYDTIDGAAELHRTFGMSRNTLWRRFREEVGCSPQEYRRFRREQA